MKPNRTILIHRDNFEIDDVLAKLKATIVDGANCLNIGTDQASAPEDVSSRHFRFVAYGPSVPTRERMQELLDAQKTGLHIVMD